MMDKEYTELIIGSLLHDIGKVIFRTGERSDHSTAGYRYLKDEIGISPEAHGIVLDAVRYHHGKSLAGADIPDDSPAYITYIADNISSAADRRESENPEAGFDRLTPLESIFNRLNGSSGQYYYKPGILGENGFINYPSPEKTDFSDSQYSAVKLRITDALKNGIEWDNRYINSLLEVLEAALTYIPSSTSKKEAADISLYDHSKITAAVASCIYLYLKDKGETDYRKLLFKEAEKFYGKNVFLLYSIDISGIQSFIYTITSKGALKTLRARSFYLEIFMENLIDELFEETDLSRANLIYCGGGHMYALMPDTEKIRNQLDSFEKKINRWLLKNFKTSVYVASGYASCSANALKNEPSGSYKAIYAEISRNISEKKAHRYTADEIIWLNSGKAAAEGRECKICKTVGDVDEDGLCTMCASMRDLSNGIIKNSFFAILSSYEKGSIPLMEDRWLVSESEENVRKRIKDGTNFVRAFSKNAFFTGNNIASKLWVGDYTTGNTTDEHSEAAEGINRIGVLRMDVDSLGQAFVSGFENKKNNDRYVTLSRTASFSRHMTVFFKYHINSILRYPESGFIGRKKETDGGRNADIVYSGGDDVFLIGSWNDVVETAVDIREKFMRYSQGTLTISGGIGLYNSGYPIHVMAEETGMLEDMAKKDKKNAVTLFDETGRYMWDEFENSVIAEKYSTIKAFFDKSDERGKNFLYNLLELLRNRKEKINTARFIYLLSRLEPDKNNSEEEWQSYKEFSNSMYSWMKSDEDSRQVITAIYLYIYREREVREAQIWH
jgi:CRISPR-associated protein Csm1